MTTTSDPRRALGAQGEAFALGHLQARGYTLIAQNHRTRYGEIDLIVTNGQALVFVEVKTRRRNGPAGSPLDALTVTKQRQVRAMARAWLAETMNRPRLGDIRFDAVGVTVDRDARLVGLDHLEGCF